LKYLAVVGERIAHDLRAEAYGHLHKLSLSFFTKKPTGQLISRISHDTDRLWDFIAFGLIEIVMSLVTIVGVCAVMFWTAPMLAVLTLIPIPIGIIMTYYHTRRMHGLFHRIWRKWSKMTATLSDAIPGIRVVKAFTQEDREITRFNSRSKDVLDEGIRLHNEWTGYWPKVTLLLQMGNLIIWAYAGPRILHQEFTLGTFVMFTSLIWMFYGPVEQLGMMNRLLQRAATSAQRVFEIIDTPLTIYSPANPVAAPKIEGRITFENVSFSYDGVKPTLTDVSFDIKPGEMIGLAGPSGSGKTTLVNVICRFYDVSRGRILIDGVDVRDLDLHEMRSQVGMVLQEPYLFSGTILANISYGNDEADTSEIIRAAKAANAHDFIVGFPDGYDTVVGERGQTLSGGERQRISIARAILNDPRILILDEATSSVDTETEMKIQEAIRHLVKGRTTFAIAHRLSTLQAADRLMVLEKGKLVQLGTYQELIGDKDGLYARLHKTQTELQSMFAV
jgi:ATP-binding cassette subfamily B protein